MISGWSLPTFLSVLRRRSVSRLGISLVHNKWNGHSPNWSLSLCTSTKPPHRPLNSHCTNLLTIVTLDLFYVHYLEDLPVVHTSIRREHFRESSRSSRLFLTLLVYLFYWTGYFLYSVTVKGGVDRNEWPDPVVPTFRTYPNRIWRVVPTRLTSVSTLGLDGCHLWLYPTNNATVRDPLSRLVVKSVPSPSLN